MGLRGRSALHGIGGAEVLCMRLGGRSALHEIGGQKCFAWDWGGEWSGWRGWMAGQEPNHSLTESTAQPRSVVVSCLHGIGGGERKACRCSMAVGMLHSSSRRQPKLVFAARCCCSMAVAGL
eukprot:56502-Chlamydomonas_euryale.AAC.4